MLVVTGSFDSDRCPVIKIRVGGLSSQPQEFQAIIDTGFTGFLSMPLLQAIPLGLTLCGTTDVTLADGKTSEDKLLYEGQVTVGERTEKGYIVLDDTSTEVLVGVRFLRTFKLMLTLTSEAVVLVDESELQKFFAEAEAKRKANKKALPKPNQPESGT